MASVFAVPPLALAVGVFVLAGGPARAAPEWHDGPIYEERSADIPASPPPKWDLVGRSESARAFEPEPLDVTPIGTVDVGAVADAIHGARDPAPPSASPGSPFDVSADENETTVPGWGGAPIRLNGWILLAYSKGTQALYKLPILRPPGSLPKIWERYEDAERTSGEGMSVVGLEEIDCVNRRTRAVQIVVYQDNNLQGAMIGASSTPGEWSSPDPGTFIAGLFSLVCDG
jgi:hypothetical protein